LGCEIDKVLDADGDDKHLATEKAIARARVEPRCFTAFEKWPNIIATLDSGDARASHKISALGDLLPQRPSILWRGVNTRIWRGEAGILPIVSGMPGGSSLRFAVSPVTEI
jgi:hypothetical protein